MANRVDVEDVKEILDTELSEPQIEAFIRAANLIVTNNLTDDITDTDLLKEIERWLAAHLACAREKQVQAEQTTDAQATYTGKTGLGLDSTFYGQTVKIIDTSGILASLDGGAKRAVSLYAVEQFDATDEEVDW